MTPQITLRVVLWSWVKPMVIFKALNGKWRNGELSKRQQGMNNALRNDSWNASKNASGKVSRNASRKAYGNVSENALGNDLGNFSGNTSRNVSENAFGSISGNSLGNVSGNVSRYAPGHLAVIVSIVFLMKPRRCMITL